MIMHFLLPINLLLHALINTTCAKQRSIDNTLIFDVTLIQFSFSYRCANIMHVIVFTSQMLKYFSQVVLRVCTLVFYFRGNILVLAEITVGHWWLQISLIPTYVHTYVPMFDIYIYDVFVSDDINMLQHCTHLHIRLAGDNLYISEPCGEYLGLNRLSAKKVVLIAGGSGMC